MCDLVGYYLRFNHDNQQKIAETLLDHKYRGMTYHDWCWIVNKCSLDYVKMYFAQFDHVDPFILSNARPEVVDFFYPHLTREQRDNLIQSCFMSRNLKTLQVLVCRHRYVLNLENNIYHLRSGNNEYADLFTKIYYDNRELLRNNVTFMLVNFPPLTIENIICDLDIRKEHYQVLINNPGAFHSFLKMRQPDISELQYVHFTNLESLHHWERHFNVNYICTPSNQ